MTPDEYNDRVAKLNQYKSPKTMDKYVGVELEFSSPTPINAFYELLFAADLDKYASIGYDGGYYNGEVGYEFRILVKQAEMEPILKAFGKLISEAGGKHHENSGFHVHLDMRQRNPAKVFNNLVQVQDILFAIADPIRSKGRGAHWCGPQKTTDITAASKGKYTAINPLLYENKNTIEVRIRESCVDGTDIYNWVKLLCRIADNPKIKTRIGTLQILSENIKLSRYIREYIAAKMVSNKVRAKLYEQKSS